MFIVGPALLRSAVVRTMTSCGDAELVPLHAENKGTHGGGIKRYDNL